MPTGSGARFDSSGCGLPPRPPEFQTGCEFAVLSSIDRENTTHDWGHRVLPVSSLSRDLKVGWAPGSDILVLDTIFRTPMVVGTPTLGDIDIEPNHPLRFCREPPR